MNKIIFVTGDTLSGKTRFIRKTYGREPYTIVLDFPGTSLTLTGGLEILDDDRAIVDIYNHLAEVALLGLFDDHDLVVEWNSASTSGDELAQLIQQAKSVGLKVKVQHLTCNPEKCLELNELAKNDLTYYPSRKLNEHAGTILSNVLEDFKINQSMEMVLELTGIDGTYQFFCIPSNLGMGYYFVPKSKEGEEVDLEGPGAPIQHASFVDALAAFDQVHHLNHYVISEIKVSYRPAYQEVINDRLDQATGAVSNKPLKMN